MHTFFFKRALIAHEIYSDEYPELVQHMLVRRIREGEQIRLLDGNGGEVVVIVVSISRKAISIKQLQTTTHTPKKSVHLWIPPLELGHWESILTTCTQIGITDFHLMQTDYSQPQRYIENTHKQHRALKLVEESCAQSEQMFLPTIHWNVQHLSTLPIDTSPHILHLVGIERSTHTIKEMINNKSNTTKEVHIYIGPEGGWSPTEKERLSSAPFTPLSFSQTGILRAETAATCLAFLAREYF